MAEIRKVGFIGVGNMGNPMAGRLVQAGFDVTVYDARPETAEIFVGQHGGRRAASAEEAARGADALITMLPDGKVVRKVLLGENGDGAAAALAPGAMVIDMGTCSPTDTQALHALLAARGIDVVDAPVMGGVVFARDATLDIMAGGDAAAVERCRPLLAAMGRSVVYCGAVGTGHALKALANYVNACALINAIEALTIGKRLGLDARLMADALIPMCTGRNHPIEKKVLPHILTGRHATGMAMGFIAKDVRIALEAAQSIGAFAPLAERVSELWSAAAEKLGPGLDQTQIARYWEDANGVRLDA
jgi:3-hydroxyisobutyrate dehydrogenase